jgi:hypothetical protein
MTIIPPSEEGPVQSFWAGGGGGAGGGGARQKKGARAMAGVDLPDCSTDIGEVGQLVPFGEEVMRTSREALLARKQTKRLLLKTISEGPNGLDC